MKYLAFVGTVVATLGAPALADEGTQEDHVGLRKLKVEVLQAVDHKDYDGLKSLLYPGFMATLETQDSFTDFDKLAGYYKSLFTREQLRMKDVKLDADADELSHVYEGRIAITRGPTKEHYELADGRSFDIAGRWTAVSIKDGDSWKLLAAHAGVNFLDNPVVGAIERGAVWMAAVAGLAGLVLGAFVGAIGAVLFRRRRSSAKLQSQA